MSQDKNKWADTYRSKEFPGFYEEPPAVAEQAEKQRKVDVSQLVTSDHWALLKRSLEAVLARYRVPLPSNPEGVVAYQTYCIMKDFANSVIEEMEKDARDGIAILHDQKHNV